ncbi:MAG: hypothetical protein MZV64_04980 [Ignavibacteriales bacterium]|nr:hypothetical protein [Ignavibacteriales bacterium]
MFPESVTELRRHSGRGGALIAAPIASRKRGRLLRSGDLTGTASRAQTRRGLGLVDDDDHAAGYRRGDLLAQRAAAALDQVQIGIDLVGAIDGHIEIVRQIIRHQRNAQPPRFVLGGLRGGEAHDVAERSRLQQFTDAPCREDRRAAGAQADFHARLHVAAAAFVAAFVELRPRVGGVPAISLAASAPDPVPRFAASSWVALLRPDRIAR